MATTVTQSAGFKSVFSGLVRKHKQTLAAAGFLAVTGDRYHLVEVLRPAYEAAQSSPSEKWQRFGKQLEAFVVFAAK